MLLFFLQEELVALKRNKCHEILQILRIHPLSLKDICNYLSALKWEMRYLSVVRIFGPNFIAVLRAALLNKHALQE